MPRAHQPGEAVFNEGLSARQRHRSPGGAWHFRGPKSGGCVTQVTAIGPLASNISTRKTIHAGRLGASPND